MNIHNRLPSSTSCTNIHWDDRHTSSVRVSTVLAPSRSLFPSPCWWPPPIHPADIYNIQLHSPQVSIIPFGVSSYIVFVLISGVFLARALSRSYSSHTHIESLWLSRSRVHIPARGPKCLAFPLFDAKDALACPSVSSSSCSSCSPVLGFEPT